MQHSCWTSIYIVAHEKRSLKICKFSDALNVTAMSAAKTETGPTVFNFADASGQAPGGSFSTARRRESPSGWSRWSGWRGLLSCGPRLLAKGAGITGLAHPCSSLGSKLSGRLGRASAALVSCLVVDAQHSGDGLVPSGRAAVLLAKRPTSRRRRRALLAASVSTLLISRSAWLTLAPASRATTNEQNCGRMEQF